MSASKFKVGDKVFSFHFGFGVVENILDDKGNPYPVAVRWSDDSKCRTLLTTFLKMAYMTYRMKPLNLIFIH